jgi:hypothetical protein
MPLFIPLYSEDGGEPLAFACGCCPAGKRAVFRTKIGFLRHLWRKHKLREQMTIEFKEPQ